MDGTAPVTVSAKLAAGLSGLGKPNVTAGDSRVFVNASLGSFTLSSSVELDGPVWAESAAAADVCRDASAPLLGTVLSGVNACLLVAGNAEHSLIQLCEGTASAPGLAAHVFRELWHRVGAKRDAAVASGGGMEAGLYFSALAVDDERAYDLAAGSDPLRRPCNVIDSEWDGPVADGALQVGPISSSADVEELLDASTSAWELLIGRRQPRAKVTSLGTRGPGRPGLTKTQRPKQHLVDLSSLGNTGPRAGRRRPPAGDSSSSGVGAAGAGSGSTAGVPFSYAVGAAPDSRPSTSATEAAVYYGDAATGGAGKPPGSPRSARSGGDGDGDGDGEGAAVSTVPEEDGEEDDSDGDNGSEGGSGAGDGDEDDDGRDGDEQDEEGEVVSVGEDSDDNHHDAHGRDSARDGGRSSSARTRSRDGTALVAGSRPPRPGSFVSMPLDRDAYADAGSAGGSRLGSRSGTASSDRDAVGRRTSKLPRPDPANLSRVFRFVLEQVVHPPRAAAAAGSGRGSTGVSSAAGPLSSSAAASISASALAPASGPVRLRSVLLLVEARGLHQLDAPTVDGLPGGHAAAGAGGGAGAAGMGAGHVSASAAAAKDRGLSMPTSRGSARSAASVMDDDASATDGVAASGPGRPAFACNRNIRALQGALRCLQLTLDPASGLSGGSGSSSGTSGARGSVDLSSMRGSHGYRGKTTTEALAGVIGASTRSLTGPYGDLSLSARSMGAGGVGAQGYPSSLSSGAGAHPALWTPVAPASVLANAEAARGILAQLVPEAAPHCALFPLEASPLTHLLSEALGGGVSTYVTSALLVLATSGVPGPRTLAALDVAAALRRLRTFPVQGTDAARALHAQQRRTALTVKAAWEFARQAQEAAQAQAAAAQAQAAQAFALVVSSGGAGAAHHHASDGPSGSAGGGLHRRRRSAASTSSSVAGGDGASDAGSYAGGGAGGGGGGSGGGGGPDAAELVALRYEEDVVALSAQLLESELDNARLRDAVEGDGRGLLEAKEEAERKAREATAARRAAEARFDALRSDIADAEGEMGALRSSLATRTAEAAEARERAAALQAQCTLLEGQARELGARLGATAASKGTSEAVLRRQLLSLFSLALRLRARVSALTPDPAEYEAYSRPADGLSIDDVLREVPGSRLPGPGNPAVADTIAALPRHPSSMLGGPSSGPGSSSALAAAGSGAVVTLRRSGDRAASAGAAGASSAAGAASSTAARGMLPYAELGRRLDASAAQNGRMREALAAASAHIRSLRDKIASLETALQVQASMSTTAAANAMQAKLTRAEESLAAYRAHLTRARDALVAAKATAAAKDKQLQEALQHGTGAGSGAIGAGTVAGKLLEETRAQLLLLQERNGRLALEADELRAALASAGAALEIDPEDPSLGNRYRAAEKRVATLMVANSRLQARLEGAEGKVAQLTAGFERKIRALLRQFEVDAAVRARGPGQGPGAAGGGMDGRGYEYGSGGGSSSGGSAGGGGSSASGGYGGLPPSGPAATLSLDGAPVTGSQAAGGRTRDAFSSQGRPPLDTSVSIRGDASTGAAPRESARSRRRHAVAGDDSESMLPPMRVMPVDSPSPAVA